MDQWLALYLAASALFMSEAQSVGVVGVNYGMLGDNLPPANKVVALVKSRNITKIRLFNPNPDALNALEGSGIEVILGTLNEDLPELGSDPSFAEAWVNMNVVPHAHSLNFICISTGNEVIPSDLATNVLPAMKNLDSALKAHNLQIPVSTAVATSILGVSYPPSQGAFSEEAGAVMTQITTYLETTKTPLLLNVYPSFAYANDQNDIQLDYALFTAKDVIVHDGALKYYNLFDAIVDSVYSGLEKAGGSSIEIIVSESGWPSAGNGDIATIANAKAYNNNLIGHLVEKPGTPKRPGKNLEAYVFAIFNENLKPNGTEQNFGLYHPNMTEVYHVDFFP